MKKKETIIEQKIDPKIEPLEAIKSVVNNSSVSPGIGFIDISELLNEAKETKIDPNSKV